MIREWRKGKKKKHGRPPPTKEKEKREKRRFPLTALKGLESSTREEEKLPLLLNQKGRGGEESLFCSRKKLRGGKKPSFTLERGREKGTSTSAPPPGPRQGEKSNS